MKVHPLETIVRVWEAIGVAQQTAVDRSAVHHTHAAGVREAEVRPHARLAALLLLTFAAHTKGKQFAQVALN